MPYRVKSGLIAQSVDGELLLLNREQEKIHQLNPVASFIWNKLDGQNTLEQLVTAITEKYDVEQNAAKRDLERLLNELSDLNLIEVV
jgi:methyltransferase-like protein